MLDSESFEKVWNNGIVKFLRYYCERVPNLKLKKEELDVKKEIWDNYCIFNKQCRNYMDDSLEKLDRHKVVACYIFAIIKSNPFVYDKVADDGYINVATEQMAITIGLKIFQGFLISRKDRNDKDKDKDKYNIDVAIFGKGFVFPGENEVAHGGYRDNFAIELYYTSREENYNILSLSHSLYLLEMYNRLRWELQHKQ